MQHANLNTKMDNSKEIVQNQSLSSALNPWKYTSFVLALLVVGLSLRLIQLSNIKTQPLSAPSQPPNNSSSSTSPQTTTVYFGKFNNKPSLFLKKSSIANASQDSSSTVWVIFEDGTMTASTFNSLQEEFSFSSILESQDLSAVTNFKLDPTSQYIYVATMHSANTVSKIFQINLADKSPLLLWSGKISPTNGGQFNGRGNIMDVFENKFVEIRLATCDEGPCLQPEILINTTTKQQKELGPATNISVNLEANSVSYQSLELVETPCPPEPMPYCGRTLQAIDKTLTAVLP